MRRDPRFALVRAFALLGGLAAALLPAAHAPAQSDAKIYETVPSQAELGRDLFPESQPAPHRAGPRTRSLVREEPAPAAAAAPAPGAPAAAPQAAPATPARVGFKIQFARDSSELGPESRQFVDVLANLLKEPAVADKRLLIEGHTDASGPDYYNYQLSKRRAEAVVAELRNRHGIDPARLVVSGRGEDMPLRGRAPDDPENRRVEFMPVP